MNTLGVWLWRSAQLEGYAAGVAARLTHRGALLRPEERDFVGDVIFPEELAHRNALREIARAMDVPAPVSLAVPNLKTELSELDALMILTRGEGALLLEVEKFRGMLERTGLPQVGDAFNQIVLDERGHRQWSRRVVHRLHQDGYAIPPRVLAGFQPFWDVRALVDTLVGG